MGLTRRKFLAGIALGGTGALAAGMTGCAAKTQDAELSSGSKDASADRIKHTPESTETYDIVVVGSGTAGMSAAVRAAQLGAKVVMLEKNAFFGGSSGYAEGVGGMKRQACISIRTRCSSVRRSTIIGRRIRMF